MKASRNIYYSTQKQVSWKCSPIDIQQCHPTTITISKGIEWFAWQKSHIRHKCKSLRNEVISWKYIFTYELLLSLMFVLSIRAILFLLFPMALKTSSDPAHWSRVAMFIHILFFVKGHWSVFYWTMAEISTSSSSMSLISLMKHFCSYTLLGLVVGLESWYHICWI